MIRITGKDATNAWCVYTLHDEQGALAFVFHSKVANVMSLRDAVSNPAFDPTRSYIFNVQTYYRTAGEAQNAVTRYIQQFGTPDLNKTVRWNRRTQVRCIETGAQYRNQLECAKALGINQSQLSQHLRRNPGFKTIKGCTFENVADAGAVTPVQYPAR